MFFIRRQEMVASQTQDRLRGPRRTAAWALVLANLFIAARINAAEPTWAKAAVALEPPCDHGPSAPLQRISSPDRTAIAEIDCRRSDRDYGPIVRVISHGWTQTLPLVDPGNDLWRPQELLWSPDSRMFLVNGGENAYAGFGVVVYELGEAALVRHDVTASAQKDMLVRFPPCKALNADDSDCKRMEADPDFNMSAIAWTNGSSNIVVFAEVPCSSSYGGIMCQVQGYELDAKTGRILKRLDARELKRQWQTSAAWNIRIPEPAEYKRPR